MPEPTVPDLRTAAQALAAAVAPIAGHCAVCVTSNGQHQAACELVSLRAALAAEATEPPPGDFDVIWTCPPCRRSEHGDCIDAGPGVCLCARRNHLASGSAPDPQGADEPIPDLLGDLEASIAPDEPTDDDLANRLRLAASHIGDAHGWDALLDEAAAEVERLRAENGALRTAYQLAETALAQWEASYPDISGAAAPASEDDELIIDADAFEHFARTADPAALAELIEKATGAKVASVSVKRAAGSPPPTPAPAREQVANAVRPWFPYRGDGLDDERVAGAADAVMALWSAEPAPPLWTGPVEDLAHSSEDPDIIAIADRLPPGTAVEVRARV